MRIPHQVDGFFKPEHFKKYPLVEIPQVFFDSRGSISNLVDGQIGDVALIRSSENTVRATHWHLLDWHFCYLVSGSFTYEWSNNINDSTVKRICVESGQMIFTPAETPHQIKFTEDSIFLAISALSRTEENYEKDTNRIESSFFD